MNSRSTSDVFRFSARQAPWNAKDGNLDRDLSAYRAWHEAGVISAAVLITQDRVRLKGYPISVIGTLRRQAAVQKMQKRGL